MKAIIMAGGMGKRLRAVSGELPKPMTPFLGRPMMEHIVLLLREEGFCDICAAVKYRAGDIMDHFGTGEKFGVHIDYRVEEKALGTAGAVKNCADFIGADDFLIISGDAVCDFRLHELMEKRRDSGAVAALALYRDARPLRYGLAVTDESCNIKAFIEKPSWPRVVTDLVNTGIYAASSRLLEHIPSDEPSDFGRDIFPALLKSSEKLAGIPMGGYWCDAGTPEAYYRSAADALAGKVKLDIPSEYYADAPADCEDADKDGWVCYDVPCADRARLMGTLSSAEYFGKADYSDGLLFRGDGYSVHFSPLSAESAVRIRASARDAELARELAINAKMLAEALGRQ